MSIGLSLLGMVVRREHLFPGADIKYSFFQWAEKRGWDRGYVATRGSLRLAPIICKQHASGIIYTFQSTCDVLIYLLNFSNVSHNTYTVYSSNTSNTTYTVTIIKSLLTCYKIYDGDYTVTKQEVSIITPTYKR